jgi:hypothetical protein
MDVASTPSSSNPRCTKCHGILDSTLDMTRTTSRYYKNCNRCRDKRTASNRRRPGLAPQFTTIAAESRSPWSRKATSAVSVYGRSRNQTPWRASYDGSMAIGGREEARRVATRRVLDTTRREARLDAKRQGLDSNPANEVTGHAVRVARQLVSREENRDRTARDARRAEERELEINRTTVPVIHTPIIPNTPRTRPVDTPSIFARIRALQVQAGNSTPSHDGDRTNIPVMARPATNYLPPRQLYAESGMSATNEMATRGGFTDTIYGTSSLDHTPTKSAPTATSPAHGPEHVSANPTSTIECSVCSDGFSPEEFPRLGACSHEPRVCQECLLGWLNQRMASTTWEQIQCPSSECTNAISHDDVKRYAPLEMFTRYAPVT